MSELITEEKQKFCKHCGEKIPEDAVLCTHCGRQVENITQSAANTPNIVINNANSNVNTNNNTINAAALKKPRNKRISLLLCLFLGYVGAHKFYEGKIGMGVLYLFTGGLFLIGVIVDLISIIFKPNPYYV